MHLKATKTRLLCACLCGLGLKGASDPGQTIMELMYAKLATSFSATGGSALGGEFLLLTCPGIAIDKQQTEDPYDVSILLDQVPALSRTYVPTSTTYSATYATVLRHSKVTPFQNQADLNRAHELKRLMYDRRRPGRPTQAYADFLKYRANHASAQDTLAMAKAEAQASGRPMPPDLDRAVAQALKLWETLGHKQAFEAAFTALQLAYNSNARLLFYQLNRDLNEMVHDDGHPTPWYPVVAVPPITEWLAPAGWKDWTFHSSEHSAPAPAFKAPLAAPGAKPAPPIDAAWAGSIAMSAHLKRVTITRPWFDTEIFHSHTWYLSKDGPYSVIATGDPNDAHPGLMPLLVTGVLLAKDLVMSGQWDGAQGSQAAPKALGPFSLASPAPTRALPLHPYVTPGNGHLAIRVEGTQIIGVFCQLLPKAPTPDPKLFR